ncbi:MAG: radical SAM family heme chaperone HemW [Acidobacteria bacterium]|nr:radical SAM family heme chaperone HemW [Acidobacteriota bacterium]
MFKTAENRKPNTRDKESEITSGCYFHIPFCARKCAYCHFLSFPFDEKTEERYANAVLMEMRLFAARRQAMPPVDSIYFGGGTPGLIPAEHIADILGECRRVFPVADGCEITLETNPGTVSLEKAAVYRTAGINRISLGAQSFSDAELRAVGRIHSSAQIADSLAMLSGAGFDNISLDLMLGLPEQDAESWRATLRAALSFPVRHISVYMLELDEASPLGARAAEGKPSLPGEDIIADLYAETIDFLGSQGLEQYEISNFARAESASRHNLKYWRRVPVYGFGLGSHSFDGCFRYANVGEIKDYCSRVESSLSPVAWRSEVTEKQALEETFFLGLRLAEGVDLRSGAAAGFLAGREKVLEEFRAEGLLDIDESRLRLTGKGMLLSNEVLECFV